MIKILLLEYNSIEMDLFPLEINDLDFNYSIESFKLIDEFESALQKSTPDLIISEYSLLLSCGKEALQIRNKLHPKIPFILITDNIELEDCIELIKQGVTDIVLKQNISSLSRKISRALKESQGIYKENSEKTKEKESNNLISDNEEGLSQAQLDNSYEAIILADKNGTIISTNYTASKMFQLSEAEITKLDIFCFINGTNANLEIHRKEIQKKERYKGEFHLLRKDGSKFLATVHSIVYADPCGRKRILLTICDLSDWEKKNDELSKTAKEIGEALNGLQKILDASLDVICSIDKEKRIVWINSACKSITGYESHELIGEKYSDLLHIEDQESTFTMEQDVRNGNPVKIFETRIIHKNGSIIHIILSAQWDENDKLIYCTAKDVSQKKKLEMAFLVERQLFLDIYDQAPSCMGILKGPNHIFELANPLYLKLINKQNIIGKTVMEVLPELKFQGVFKVLDAVYTSGHPYAANERLFRFDSKGDGNLEDKYLSFLYQAHRDNDNKIDGILFFAIDVTEQVMSRIKIEESEKLYGQLIRELPVAAYSCDADGKITFFNKAAATLWGREPEVGNDLLCGFLKILDHDGNSIPLQSSSMAIALREGRTVSGLASIIVRANGEKRHVVPHVVPYIDKLGKVTGAVNVITDLTESKAAHKSLEMRNKELADYKYAIDQSSIVEIIDDKGKIIHANENFCKITKYSLEELIGQDCEIIGAGYHSEEFLSNMWTTIGHGKTWKGEIKNKAKDGTFHWLDTTITPFLNEQGIPFQYVATKFDITERKNAEINLEKQNNELLKTNKELDRFVYSVSHDLRSPLTSIQGLISIIEDESKEPETLEHVEMIKSSINRLDEFIRKILSYSQNKRTGLHAEQILVKKTILTIVDSLQNMDNAKGIHFEIDIQEDFTFFTDKLGFNTIVENIISNAIKYHKSFNTERFIKVTGNVTNEMLQLKIADNGIGIATKHQDKIFDMFFRISSRSEGSGIGLYIVKDTIEKLEGSIHFFSVVRSGTTFEIKLKNFKIC